jgi:hypothetical protein
MKYYRLVMKGQEEDCIIINDYKLNGFDLRKIWRSEKISDWDSKIMLFFDKKGLVLDYMPNVLSWLILSYKAINVLKELDINNIQVFPVTLYIRNNPCNTFQYNIVNVVTIIQAMNKDKSEYIAWDDDPNQVKIIKRLVMNKSEIPEDVEIFNLSEAAPYIIISDKLKYALDRNNITGTDFIPIDLV